MYEPQCIFGYVCIYIYEYIYSIVCVLCIETQERSNATFRYKLKFRVMHSIVLVFGSRSGMGSELCFEHLFFKIHPDITHTSSEHHVHDI